MDPWYAENVTPRGDVGVIVDHIDHIVEVAGMDHVGLGSDFDGIPAVPEGMEDVARFPALTEELLRQGYSEAAVEKVLGGNFLRVFGRAEEVARELRKREEPAADRLPYPRLEPDRRRGEAGD